MVCRDFILPEFCKPCLSLSYFQFAQFILHYRGYRVSSWSFGRIRTADLILSKKPSCFLMSTHSCQVIPPNPLYCKGFGGPVFRVMLSAFFAFLGRFRPFVGRFVGRLIKIPRIFLYSRTRTSGLPHVKMHRFVIVLLLGTFRHFWSHFLRAHILHVACFSLFDHRSYIVKSRECLSVQIPCNGLDDLLYHDRL